MDIGPYLNIHTHQYQDSVEMIADIMNYEQYREHMRTLNTHQYEFFTHILYSALHSTEQLMVCLHGGAGTGK